MKNPRGDGSDTDLGGYRTLETYRENFLIGDSDRKSHAIPSSLPVMDLEADICCLICDPTRMPASET